MELEVGYRGEAVGRLYQDRRGQVHFEYAAAWRGGARELSPLYLPNSTAGAVTSPTPGFGPLFGLFQDALPDWWGEQMMRRRFEEAGIPWNKVTALHKLACQGDRKMGALVFTPLMEELSFADHLLAELGSLVEAARATIRGESGGMLDQLVRSGISPGGARPKALLWLSADGRELHLDEGPDREAWLVKFDIDPDRHEGRIERAYMSIAAAAGIDVPETRLIEAGSGCHFLVRRFDREAGGGRIHFHSFSGLTHTPVRDGLDYGDLMDLARELTGDHRAVEQVFRRAVFNVMAGNDDDHGRNHAFLMKDDGTWRLSPAFDLTPAANPLSSGARAGRVAGKSMNITDGDLVRLGEEQDVRRIRDVIGEVRDAVARWPEFAGDAGLPRGETASIHSQLRHLAG